MSGLLTCSAHEYPPPLGNTDLLTQAASLISNTMDNLPGLPVNITSRIIPINDLDVHILEAFPPTDDQSKKPPLLVLLHGFPEIAYSWRKIMAPLANSGFAVVAPDQRRFGQTRERGQPRRKIAYEEDLAPFRILNMVNDVVALVYSLGYTSVAAVIGHDFGARIAAPCALIRPDLFASVVLMSAPFTGPPALGDVPHRKTQTPHQLLEKQLASLDPPRRHYTMYYSTPRAANDMLNPPGGLHGFLRTYFHIKSADWKGNRVTPLKDSSPASFAALPYYYIMPLAETMAECLAPYAPSTEDISRNTWLSDDELVVYVTQYSASGFQGALNAYRCLTDPLMSEDLQVFTGKQIEVPAMFLAGAQDWGPFQMPGAVNRMRGQACRSMKDEDFVLIEGAGHWVQQEQPREVVAHMLRFLRANGKIGS